MKKISIGIEEKQFAIFLHFLQTLDYVKVLEPKPIAESTKTVSKKYDFSDLIGKLQWSGDALNEQQKLRDEW